MTTTPPKNNRDWEILKVLAFGFTAATIGLPVIVLALVKISTIFNPYVGTAPAVTSSYATSYATLEEACRSEVKKAEGGHTTFQINNAETLASGGARIFYEVGFAAGNKERRVAECSGTAENPALDLVSANAANEASQVTTAAPVDCSGPNAWMYSEHCTSGDGR